ADGEEPGSYPITLGTLALANNTSGTEAFYASDYQLVLAGDAKLTIQGQKVLEDAQIQITDTDTQVYDGTPKKPPVSVSYNGTGLEQDVDYTLTYSDNVHAGDNTAKITAKGIGNYKGEQTISFTINPRQLTVKAQNASKTEGAADPDFTYSVTNAVDTDRIIFTGALARETGEAAGDYAINQGTLALADGERYFASDYSIVFTVGSFTIDEQARWNVYFDPQNGNASILMYAVDGGTVQVPAEPYLEGYDFTGWYTDEDCTQEYDFSTGVTADLTLYAGWEVADDHSDVEYRDGYPASCLVDGYEGDMYCKKCGLYLGEGNTIPAPGYHNWVLTGTDPATSLHTGTAYYSCSECSATKTEILDIDPNNKDPYDYDDDWDDDDWDDDDDEWDDEELEEIEEELEEKGFTLNDDEETVTFQKPAKKTITSCKISPTVKVNGYTFKITGIADNAFKGCSKLKKVTIGSNVTTIGANAFKSCGKLTSVTIPAKVTHIGKNAFNGCKSLKTITIKTKSLKKIGKKAFSGIKGGAKFKLPKLNAAKKRSYKKMIKGSGAPKSSKIK
nr:leucine-rich repeat protein [Lachnospiraceae bacterium]